MNSSSKNKVLCKRCGLPFIARNTKHKICDDPLCQSNKQSRIFTPSSPHKTEKDQKNIVSGHDNYVICDVCKTWRNKDSIKLTCPVCENNTLYDKVKSRVHYSPRNNGKL